MVRAGFRACGGFTLVEVMVTVTILFLLILVGAPLTGAWVDSAKVREATHRLQEGMARAKALALANGTRVAGETPAAVLVWTGGRLCVVDSAPAALDCAGTPAWQATVSASVNLNGASPQCIALSNRALAVPVAVGAAQCGTALSYVISSGNERYPGNGTQTLY